MSPLTRFLARWSSLYQQQGDLKSKLQNAVKTLAFTLAHQPQVSSANQAIDNVFAEKNMDRQLLTIRQLAAETTRTRNMYNFDKRVKKSFLPYIIALAQEHDIQLVFVRMKRRRDAESGRQPKELIRYIQKLQEYLEKNMLP